MAWVHAIGSIQILIIEYRGVEGKTDGMCWMQPVTATSEAALGTARTCRWSGTIGVPASHNCIVVSHVRLVIAMIFVLIHPTFGAR
jgi:hypothetical protein